MPPKTPDGRAFTSASQRLAEAGLRARHAPIRSSSYRDWRECPFRFMLKHRYGLVMPARSVSPALALGSFHHISLEADLKNIQGDAKDEFVANAVMAEIARLDDMLVEQGSQGLQTIDKEELWEVSATARAWQEHAWEISPVDLDVYKPFSVEESFCLAVPWFKTHIRAKLDALCYRADRNEVWILDEKTTMFTPWTYIQTCPFQIQPRIYRIIAEHFVRAGTFEHLGIPRNATVAGMIHHVIQKPTIRVSKKTRKKEGDVAAWAEYGFRTGEWMKGIGEFRAKGEERSEQDAVINQSFIRFGGPAHGKGVFDRLHRFDNACVRVAKPENFEMHEDSLLPLYGKQLDKYYPFYVRSSTSDMKLWPDIMREKGFIQRYREDDEAEVNYTATEEDFLATATPEEHADAAR